MSQDGVAAAGRRGLVWAGAGFALTKALSFVAILILARLLVPADFGVVAAIVAFLAILELVSDLGMKAAVVFEQEEALTARVRTAFTINVALAIVLTLLAVALAPLIAAFFRIPEEAGLFRLASLNLLLVGLGNIHDSVLLRALDFRRRVRPEVARGMTRGAVSIALALLGAGAEALVVGMLAGSVAWVVTMWAMVPLRPAWPIDRAIARAMVGYGSAAFLLELLGGLGTRVDVAVIGRALGDRALGLYSVAFRLPELLIHNVGWIVSSVAFPALSRQRLVDERSVGLAALGVIRFQALYALPVATAVAMLAAPIVVVLFGPRWRDAAGVTAAIAVLMALDLMIAPLGDGLKATARQRVLVALNVVSVPFAVGGIVWAAGAGIVAVAWVRTGLQLVFAVALAVVACRQLGAPLPGLVSALVPSVVASVGVAGGCLAVQAASPGATLGTLLLGGAAALLGGLVTLRLFAPRSLAEVAVQLRKTWEGLRSAPSRA
jgi:PST family polysaccharide transporter